MKKSSETFDSEKSAAVFNALSDPTRLRILLMLDIKPRSVNEIVDFFTLTQPTISRHLRVLSKAGLVAKQKQGQKRVYSLSKSVLKEHVAGFLAKFGKSASPRER